jgi:UDP-3-O-[3-hydroxymyristoyl] glucosamine N-acyltransferase
VIYVSEILKLLPEAVYHGRADAVVTIPVTPETAQGNDGELMWLSDKNLFRLKQIRHGTIICSRLLPEQQCEACNYIIVNNPRSAFRKILEHFFYEQQATGIKSTAIIDPEATIGSDVHIGDHVVIEKNCIIGSHVVIGSGTVIRSNTHIGNYVKIGCNCTIGGPGFGYEKDDNGNWQHIPHLGKVIIHDYVSVHDNVVINRGVLNDTVIGSHTKIDSMVMIAHGVTIGSNTIICGQASIAGSVVIGNNCWIAPNVSILNKINIGHYVFVGIGAVVVSNVSDGKKIFGNPAKIVSF